MAAMLKIPHPNGDFKITKDLAATINAYVAAIFKYNQDLVIAVDGKEGAGKSTLMRQVGAYVQWLCKTKYNHDIPFDLDNIHFSLDEYRKAAVENQKTKCWINLLDESRAVANRKKSNSKSNVAFTNYLSECRSSGHIHLIALPFFHDLDSYIATARSAFLISINKSFRKVGEEDGMPIFDLILGTYRVFKVDKTLIAMYYHKMRYIYPRKSNFLGRFDNITILDEEAYDNKKDEFRAKRYGEEAEGEKKEIGKRDWNRMKDKVYSYKIKHPTATNSEIATACEVDKSYVDKIIALI